MKTVVLKNMNIQLFDLPNFEQFKKIQKSMLPFIEKMEKIKASTSQFNKLSDSSLLRSHSSFYEQRKNIPSKLTTFLSTCECQKQESFKSLDYLLKDNNVLKIQSNSTQQLPNVERLATTIEIEIFPLCQNSSINCLLEKGKIYFEEYNNSCGFLKENGKIFSNSYFLRHDSIYLPKPKNYKGYISINDIDDLFVFVNQIEQFEATVKLREARYMLAAYKHYYENLMRELF